MASMGRLRNALSGVGVLSQDTDIPMADRCESTLRAGIRRIDRPFRFDPARRDSAEIRLNSPARHVPVPRVVGPYLLRNAGCSGICTDSIHGGFASSGRSRDSGSRTLSSVSLPPGSRWLRAHGISEPLAGSPVDADVRLSRISNLTVDVRSHHRASRAAVFGGLPDVTRFVADGSRQTNVAAHVTRRDCRKSTRTCRSSRIGVLDSGWLPFG